MKNFDSSIDIRSIQQFLYCPHRYGLMEIECDWVENFFVARGNLVHNRTDSGIKSYSAKNIVLRSVKVFNDDWDIFGVVDNLELVRNKNGKYIEKYNDNFSFCIVEYKVSAPKSGTYRQEDAMQLLAQKVCVDSIFQTNSETYFYYADTKRRVKVEFCDGDYQFLWQTLLKMRELRASNIIPKIENEQYCSGCSFNDICFPKVVKLEDL